MKPTYEGLTLNQLAERNAEHVTNIERLEAQVKQLAAENSALKELIEQHAGSIAVCPNCSHEEPSETDDIVALYRLLETPATDAFLSRLRNEALKDYADKQGFSFQHGSIHAHLGNGDVLVVATTFDNGEAGICFAPVREKKGGVGTEYKWTKGKNTEQVGAVFVVSSSSVAGLEVIQDKLTSEIESLREGKAGEVVSD